MRRIGIAAMAIGLLMTGAASAQNHYGWSLSEADDDPCINMGAPSFGVKTLYLWNTYSPGDNMAAADLTFEGSLVPLAFNGENGYLNAGDAVNLLLAVGGCPQAPILAGSILIIDTGGYIAIGGARLTVDCVVNDAWESGTTGWSSDGSEPVEYEANGGVGCAPPWDPSPVQPESWSGVKAMYR